MRIGRADPDTRLCGNSETPRYSIGISIEHTPYHTRSIGWAIVMKAKQHHPVMEDVRKIITFSATPYRVPSDSSSFHQFRSCRVLPGRSAERGEAARRSEGEPFRRGWSAMIRKLTARTEAA